MDNQQQLFDLRGQIINELTPLMESVTVEPQQKFAILLLASRNNGSSDSFRAAYEAANKIEDNNTKLDALVELLEEIEFQLRPREESTAKNVPPSNPDNQP